MSRITVGLFAAAAALLLAPGFTSAADEPPLEANRAQVLVFMGDHLRETQQGQILTYDFARHETGQPDKADKVSMTVTKVRDDARRDLSFDFLSGDDQIDFPDAHGYRGNPIAIQFLERDIRDMSRLTGQSSAYFRSRIRRAFREPQIEDAPVDVGGRQINATQITVVPFVDDPVLAEVDGYTQKEYLFVYSEQVPGDLVRIRTRVAKPDGNSLEEELSYHPSDATQ